MVDKENGLNYIELFMISSRFKSYKLTLSIQMLKSLFPINEVLFDLAFFLINVDDSKANLIANSLALTSIISFALNLLKYQF
jgi:hypothetical protein